jgi:hypothetical protein
VLLKTLDAEEFCLDRLFELRSSPGLRMIAAQQVLEK